jgi:hypothetical protein
VNVLQTGPVLTEQNTECRPPLISRGALLDTRVGAVASTAASIGPPRDARVRNEVASCDGQPGVRVYLSLGICGLHRARPASSPPPRKARAT